MIKVFYKVHFREKTASELSHDVTDIMLSGNLNAYMCHYKTHMTVHTVYIHDFIDALLLIFKYRKLI